MARPAAARAPAPAMFLTAALPLTWIGPDWVALGLPGVLVGAKVEPTAVVYTPGVDAGGRGETLTIGIVTVPGAVTG
jgi:hypothetical protein